MASALWLIVCLVPLVQGQIMPNTFNMQPSISPIGVSSNTDNVVSLNNNNNNNNAATASSSNSSDVPIDLSQLLLKLIRLAKDLAHDRSPFDPRPRSFPDTVDNSLISSDTTSGDSSLWSPVALIIDSGSSDSNTDTPDQPPAAAQAFNIVYGVDSGNQAANQLNPANPFPTFTATQQQPGSFAQSSSPFAMPFASSLSQTMQPPSPFATSFGMNQQQQQQPFFTASNSLMPMPMQTQDDSLPVTFNSQPSYAYGQWPHFGRWMHPWGHGGPFSWMNYLQGNQATDDQHDDDNNNVAPAYPFFKNQGEDKNVDSDEMIKPEDFNWRPKWQPRFGMDRDLLGPRMHGRRSDEGHHGGFGHLGEQRWPMENDDDDDDEGSPDEKKEWKGPEGGSSSEEQDGDEQVGPQEDSMDRGRGGRGGRGRRGKGKDCMCKKVTRILDEMKRKHRGGRRAMFDDN